MSTGRDEQIHYMRIKSTIKEKHSKFQNLVRPNKSLSQIFVERKREKGRRKNPAWLERPLAPKYPLKLGKPMAMHGKSQIKGVLLVLTTGGSKAAKES